MKASTRAYKYADCGLDNVYLYGGFAVKKTPYGKSISIIDLDGLHRCISQCLVEKPGRLTGTEFRFLRTELDMSQEMIGALCGVGERMVRSWESKEEVGEPQNTIIRVIYRERYDNSVTFEGMSKMISELQALDKKRFELRLRATKDGWIRNCA